MKIALVELGGSHDECLYSQVKILRTIPDCHVTLICTEDLLPNVQGFDGLDHIECVSIERGLKKWKAIYKLAKYCRRENFSRIIFNTAQGKPVKNLLRFSLGKQTKCYGIIHDINKLKGSLSQKSITRKIERYFILNEYLKNQIPAHIPHATFYPIFFPSYSYEKVSKAKDDIWICIPGQVELKRRDYAALFNSIRAVGIAKHIKFLLLGRYGHAHGDGDYVLEQIADLGLEDNMMIWESFVPVCTFHSMLYNSDYVMPLIHQGDESGDLYENQISGAFNLALGYKKPMIVEESLVDKFEDAIAYKKSELMQVVNQLTATDNGSFYTDSKWSFDSLKEEFLHALDM